MSHLISSESICDYYYYYYYYKYYPPRPLGLTALRFALYTLKECITPPLSLP